MDCAISLHDIRLSYGKRTIVDRLSLEIPRGKFTVMAGPNGCGKSTVLKSLIHTLAVQAGEIRIEGRPLAQLGSRQLSWMVSLLPQHLLAPEGVSVRQLVGYGRSPHTNIWNRLNQGDVGLVETAMRRMDVADLADREVGALSGGQQQRAWLAMVLAQQTPIVLLDEPTSYLDISHQIEVLHLCQELAAEGKTVVAVLHDLNQAFRYADHVAVLQDGKLVATGTPENVASEDLVRVTSGIAARIIADPEAQRPMMVVRKVITS